MRRSQQRREALKFYRRAQALEAKQKPPSPDEFAAGVRNSLRETPCRAYVLQAAEILAATLYKVEGLQLGPPQVSVGASSLDLARYRDQLATWFRKVSEEGSIATARDTIVRAASDVSKFLPPLAARPSESSSGATNRQFSVRMLDLLSNVPQAVESLCRTFAGESVASAGLFDALRRQLELNLEEMSGPQRSTNRLAVVSPLQHKGSNEEIVHGYLKQTPLEKFLQTDVPFDIPQAARFEHHWIVAGSGHGKSQTLQHLIVDDLSRVAAGEASIVVIDSQGDMIKNIARLRLFAYGQPLSGKLCLIDPSDIEFPVALNLFDAGVERMEAYSELDRERLMNGVLELYDFVLGSLLSAELTQKQGVIFRYITRLMLHIPGSTIHTFRELMEPKGYESYRSHIAKLEGTARAFFETEFNSKQFEDTKRQVVRRLWGILENRTFERMFSHPKNKLNLYAEMNAGKVILINCAKDLLKQNGTEIFGRFFIALIAQAAQERATLPRSQRMPTFVYLDEAADYLDQNVSIILEQARKFNVGMVLAHQYVGQLSPKLQESFAANTSIKFVGGVSDKDARAFSHMLRCLPEFIEAQPKGRFAVSIRNVTPSALSLGIPFGRLEAMPRMTNLEHAQVLDAMRERYAVPWSEVRDLEATVSPDSRTAPVNPDTVDTSPATQW